MSKGAKYLSIVTAGFNLYNNCNFDFYNQAIGFNFQSTTGLLNFGTNLYYRVTSNENTIPMLVSGLANQNPVQVGTAMG